MNKKTELVENNVTQHPTVSQPDRLLEMAISKGADMAQLEKFMDLKERHDKNEARKDFTLALEYPLVRIRRCHILARFTLTLVLVTLLVRQHLSYQGMDLATDGRQTRLMAS